MTRLVLTTQFHCQVTNIGVLVIWIRIKSAQLFNFHIVIEEIFIFSKIFSIIIDI